MTSAYFETFETPPYIKVKWTKSKYVKHWKQCNLQLMCTQLAEKLWGGGLNFYFVRSCGFLSTICSMTRVYLISENGTTVPKGPFEMFNIQYSVDIVSNTYRTISSNWTKYLSFRNMYNYLFIVIVSVIWYDTECYTIWDDIQ